MKRFMIITVAVLALAMLAPTAFASGSGSGAGAISFTQTIKNETDQMANNPNPCTGALGTLTLTWSGVFHVTELTSGQGAGTFWATGTQAGTLSWVPNDSSQPSYTGHFANWFGDNNNLHNGSETSTFNVAIKGTDGSSYTIHEVVHMSVSATGVSISFDKPTCQ